MLDFTEIAQPNVPSNEQDAFEQLARAFFQMLGFKLAQGPSRGTDGGKDLVIIEELRGPVSVETVRWLVSCKHKAHSGAAVSETDEPNLRDRMETHGCTGFMGFYSTIISTTLDTHFAAINKPGTGKRADYYDNKKIEEALLNSAEGRVLAATHMPSSFERWKKSGGARIAAHLDVHDVVALVELDKRFPVLFKRLCQEVRRRRIALHISPYAWARMFSDGDNKHSFLKKKRIINRLGVAQHPSPSEVVAWDLYSATPDKTETLAAFVSRFRTREVELYLQHVREKYGQAYSTNRLADDVSAMLHLNERERDSFLELCSAYRADFGQERTESDPPGTCTLDSGERGVMDPELDALQDLIDTYRASEQLAMVFLQESMESLKTEAKKARLLCGLEIDSVSNSKKLVLRNPLKTLKPQAGSFDSEALQLLNSMSADWGVPLCELNKHNLRAVMPHLRCMLGYFFGRQGAFQHTYAKAEAGQGRYEMVQLLYLPEVDFFSVQTEQDMRFEYGVPQKGKLRRGAKLWASLLYGNGPEHGTPDEELLKALKKVYG